MNVFDALLEHELREELAPRTEPADLTDAVTQALVAGRFVHVPGAAPSPRSRWRRLLPLALPLAAAGVVVAVLVAHGSRAAAVADRPLLVARSDGTFAADTSLPDGAFACCTGPSPAQLSLAAGGTATAAPGCVLAIARAAAVELLAGTLELRADARWRLRCALAEVELGPGATVRCELEPSAPVLQDPGDPSMNPAALRSRFSVPTLLTVTVLAGTADLITAQEREGVPAGEARRVTAPDPAAAARAIQLYQEVRKELPMPNDEAGMAAWKDLDGKLRDLSLLVLRQPAAVVAIRQAMVRDLADAKLGTETRARIVGLALLDEDQHTFAAVTQVWTSSTDAGEQQVDRLFSFEEQVALAERGFALAAGKLKEFLREPAGALSARAAAALAFGGDGSAREMLKPWSEVTVDAAIENFENLNARCQAAVGLAALGDSAAVPALRTFVRDLVEKLLERSDQTALAAWVVQRARYYLTSPRPRLGEVELRTDASRDDGMGESPDAARVRAALAKLAPK